ncbi:MAG: hypothetical protein CMP10_19455 [Zetaproteobacteria bacterium]|nr:hypothetical protein [Pseudobdellovibrionaceae bacterium]|tara:strand:+ start:685 stop:951 length:267 start_codon:yes stop_codon:yes gene_type:complete
MDARKKKLLVTAALTGIFAAGGLSSPLMAKSVKGQCHGVNGCKGKGDCSGKGYTCAGNNSCKGKGWKKMTEKQCNAELKKKGFYFKKG